MTVRALPLPSDMPQNRILLGYCYLWASPPLWWVFCPFPFLFFFYSKTIYLPSPKNVLIFRFFLLLDHTYSFSKKLPPLKNSSSFSKISNFSKLFSSQKILPPWLLTMNGKIPISWIFLGQCQSRNQISNIQWAPFSNAWKSWPPLQRRKKYGEHRKQGLPPLTSGARSISTRDSGTRGRLERQRDREASALQASRGRSRSRERSCRVPFWGLSLGGPPGQAGGEGRCRQPLGKDRPIWGLWRRPT